MAVGFVASASSGSQASVASFNIGTLGTGARAGIVFVVTHNSATAKDTGVTWNGTSMSLLYSATDTDTEPGVVRAYFLDNVTNGTITVSRTNDATVTVGYAASISASYAAYVAQTITRVSSTQNTDANTSTTGTGASDEVSVNDGSPGTNSMRFAAYWSGAATPPTQGANSTALQVLDSTAYGSRFVRETTAGQGSRGVGATTGTTDDWAIVAVAVAEKAPKTITADFLDASAAIYAPEVQPDQFITVGLLDGAAAIYAPTLTAITPTQSLTLPLIGAVPGSYVDTVLASGPVGYWRFGEPSGTTADNLGSAGATLDGTYQNTPTLGVAGAVGDSDTAMSVAYTVPEGVTVPDDASIDLTTNFTLEAWVRPTLAVSGTVMSKYYGPGPQAWYFVVNANGSVAFGGNLTGTVECASAAGTLRAGVWHHVVVTYGSGANTGKVYINGSDVTSAGPGTTFGSNDGPLWIGYEDNSAGFDGAIDEVAVYGRVLSAEEVLAHFTAGRWYDTVVLADSPVAYLPLQEVSGTLAEDIASTHDGTYSGTYTLGVAGPNGAVAAYLDANAGYIVIPHHADLNLGDGPMSLEIWVNRDTDAWMAHLINKGFDAYAVSLEEGGSYGKNAIWRGGDATFIAMTGAAIEPSNWYHLVFTKDGASDHIYVNGYEDTTHLTGNTLSDTTNDLQIGRNPTPSISLDAKVSRFAVYDHVLTAAQVFDHYEASTSTPQSGGRVFPLAVEPVSTLALPPVGSNDYSAVVLADSPLAYWRLGEATGSVADNLGSGGASMDGAYSGGASLVQGSASPLVGDPNAALTFAGNGNVIVPSGTALDTVLTNFTIEAWIKWHTGNNDYPTAVAKNNAWELYRREDNGQVRFGRAGGTTEVYTTENVAPDEWHHVVVTYGSGGGTGKLYIDAKDVSVSGSATFTEYASPVYLGSYDASSFFLGDGAGLDEVAIYSSVLTPAQVRAHYEAGRGIYAPTLTQAGAQNITVPLLDGSAAIYAPTVTFTLAVPLIDGSSAIYAPTLTPKNTLTVGLLDGVSSIYAPTLVGKYLLSPQLLDGVSAIYAPTLKGINWIFEPDTIESEGRAIYAPTLTPKNLIDLGLIDAGSTLYAPAVQPDQFVTLVLLESTPDLYAPTLVTVALTVTIPLLDGQAAIYDLTVLPQPVTVTLTSLIDGGAAIYDVTVVAGPLSIAPPLLDAGPDLYAPTLVGKNTLTVGLIDGGAALYAPTVQPDQFITLGLLDGSAAQYAPTLTQGPARISLDLIDGGAAIYEATVLSGTNTLAVPLLDASAAIYAVTLAVGPITFVLPLLDGLAEQYALTVTPAPWPMVVPLLDSGASIFTPTLTRYVTFSLPLLDGLAAQYAVTLTVGPVGIDLGLIDAGAAVYAIGIFRDDFVSTSQFMRQVGVRGREAGATMAQKR